MKKFKKSYVILPAIATMALTTVASVTGTVAWFTANRAVTVSATKFETVSENSNLSVTLTQGQGTTVSSQTVSVSGLMTHGSFDADKGANGNLYVATMDGDAQITAYSNKGGVTPTTSGEEGSTSTTTWKSATKSANKDVWYGVAWSMEFSYTGAQGSGENYLLYDIAGTSWTKDGSDALTGDTYKGLRIAMMTSDKLLVIGGREGSSNTEIKHVKSGDTTSANGKFTYGTDYTIYSDNTSKLADGAANVSSSMFSIGKIGGSTKISMTVVAWFEGEDASIVDYTDKTNQTATVMSTVVATLPFYVRNTVA